MKSFSERNPLLIGAIGVALTSTAVLIGLNYKHLPFVETNTEYSAFFADAGGLMVGADVQVSGYTIGNVSSVELDGPQVLVKFDVANNVHLGDRTEAAIKTKSLLGTKLIQVFPFGQSQLSQPIPLNRTTPAYQLPDALGDLANTVEGLNTDQLSQSLKTLTQTFAHTAPDLQLAVQGLGRFSQSLASRDGQLRNLLANANKATAVLADRSDQVVSLIRDTNALLAQLRTESNAVDQISGSLSGLSRQLSGFVSENRQQLRPALDKLNGVLTILANRKDRIQESIKRLNNYAISLGESVSSGPWFNAYIANLLPGQFLQPFVDAAFSDLGLDPHTLSPSKLADPQTGQPATPPLPPPFPRTGQGGEPRRNLPDAITGKPGDPRYPYREPPPAPPPGGPPPGPPAITPPEPGSTPQPGPAPKYVPAPGEVPAPRQAGS
ncbi:MCE family protein [Mycobacterium sp.]|uniref:MCE family protein n=1 Tax=Mycobacterium sp. TaxID=1785 RepID=UPI003D104AD1